MLWNLKRGIFTVLLVFYVAGCGAAKDGTNITISDIGNVEGTVTDLSSSTALSGVTIQIGDKTATTGSNGVYSIQDISVGTRTVTASKTGYQNHNGTCEVNKGTTVVHNIQLTANTSGDTTPPTVSSTNPANNATDIAVNSALTATFSEAMDVSTITTSTFTLKQGTTPVSGTVTYSGTTATFTPSSNLSYSTSYTATIATGAKDTAGNAMTSNYTWSFTTGNASGPIPPVIISTNPVSNATGILVNNSIVATFSEAMDTSTINNTTFTVSVGGNNISGTVSYSGISAIFSPSTNLSGSATYKATITTGVKDLAGNALSSNYVWSFKTGAGTDTIPPTNTTSANFINGGASSSPSTMLTLSISATDNVGVTGYYISQNSTAPSAASPDWKATSVNDIEYPVPISNCNTGTWSITLYLWFKDADGNISTAVSDSINVNIGSGSLDCSFGASGTVTTSIGSGYSADAIAIQPDGKIIVAGTIGADFVLIRYNTDGSLDATFGIGGKVVTDVGNNSADAAKAIKIQSDGKIVVVGQTYDVTSNFGIVRYNTDGSVDTSFGSGGKVITTGAGNGNGVVIQSDGKIVVAGGTAGDFALVRYNTNGSIDTSFGTAGKVTTDIGGSSYYDSATSIGIQTDGKIVLSGYSNKTNSQSFPSFALARYNTDGSLDTNFGTSGKVTTDIGTSSQALALAIQSDGKIVVAGLANLTNGSEFALVRYNGDGSLDTTFGAGGKVITNGVGGWAWALGIQADGKIVVSGGVGTNIHQSAVVRYNTDGSLDSTFGASGIATTPIGILSVKPTVLSVQSDGKMVVVGSYDPTMANGGVIITTDIILFRYLP